jgi:hypothetical protein
LQLLPQYIAEKKKEPVAPEKTLAPVMSPSFQELYEEDWWCIKNAGVSYNVYTDSSDLDVGNSPIEGPKTKKTWSGLLRQWETALS